VFPCSVYEELPCVMLPLSLVIWLLELWKLSLPWWYPLLWHWKSPLPHHVMIYICNQYANVLPIVVMMSEDHSSHCACCSQFMEVMQCRKLCSIEPWTAYVCDPIVMMASVHTSITHVVVWYHNSNLCQWHQVTVFVQLRHHHWCLANSWHCLHTHHKKGVWLVGVQIWLSRVFF